jgi:hypothetical protein
MKRSGTEMAAGHGAGGEIELDVIEWVLQGKGAVSCELVLFMLMVSSTCEGRHARVTAPVPILP